MKPVFTYNGKYGTLNYHQAGPEYCTFQQTIAYPDNILIDYALENHFTINGKEIQEGYFQISKANGKSRNIQALNERTWTFLTISVVTKSVKKLRLPVKPANGKINLAAIRILLRLLYSRKSSALLDDWMEAVINLLLYESLESKSPNQPGQQLLWHDAVLVHGAVETLKNRRGPLFLDTRLEEKTGLKRYRFQKACRQLYGLSLKEMIYRKKMEETLQMVTLSDQSLKEISRLAGFNNYDNFITAFRNYYDITPALLRRATFNR
ncbi:MAG: helix-turn-helix domain-containing protein [Williamsia sp.]|nr:helix-turn-helix domain-containing protein [Williamsia sp.]